jgi:hypothetical protein
MEMSFDREKNRAERIRFIHFYANWVKSVPNEVWSVEQAELIDSFYESAAGMTLTPEQYLRILEARERRTNRNRRPGDPDR